MKRYFIILFVLILIGYTAYISFQIFMRTYVKFPEWDICDKYSIISVDNNFVRLSKPLTTKNEMFFPIKINLAAFQLQDENDNLFAMITINQPTKLSPHSVSEVPLRISLPYSLIDTIDVYNLDMTVFYSGTVQGSVWGFPFSRTMSNFIHITPQEQLIEDVLLPFLYKVKTFNL